MDSCNLDWNLFGLHGKVPMLQPWSCCRSLHIPFRAACREKVRSQSHRAAVKWWSWELKSAVSPVFGFSTRKAVVSVSATL
eukprot:1306478-Amphidinium_carterae.1